MRRLLLARAVVSLLASHGLSARAEGDAARGQSLYESRCVACHSLDSNRVGPMHRGVYGRKAGSVPDFAYSDNVKNSNIVWSAVTLDQWLTDPEKLIAGQHMNYSVTDPQDRSDLVAYLKRESGK
jgi:cytochrome c